MKKCLVVAGDSVIDNAAYVKNTEPTVAEQIRDRFGSSWHVESVARDGAVAMQIPIQLDGSELIEGASHLSITVGGNDALRLVGLIQSRSADLVHNILMELVNARAEFALNYQEMLNDIKDNWPHVKIVVSTIYYPVFTMSREQSKAIALLSLFNDVIISIAELNQLPVVDLRWISTHPSHYANSIEPSALGGQRIAETIRKVVTGHNFRGPSALYCHEKAKFNFAPFVGEVPHHRVSLEEALENYSLKALKIR